MKTINYIYENNISLLQTFILEHKIKMSKNILLQIFCGVCDKIYISKLIEILKQELPHIKIIGTTTAGEIIDGEVYENQTLLSFSLFNHTKIKTYCVKNEEDSYQNALNLITQFEKNKKIKVAISFTDGIATNADLYLKAFIEYDNDLIIAGGLAGDNIEFKKTIVFTEKSIFSNGSVIGLFYNDSLNVFTETNFGWASIGKTMTITKVVNNIIYEIDGMKAQDIYSKYLGKDIGDNLPLSAMEFPLILQHKNFKVARAILGVGEDSSLIFAGNFKKGDKVKFGYGNLKDILDGGVRISKKIEKMPVETIFAYSCVARKKLMGSKNIKRELDTLSQIAPLSGFFTYGEFFSSSHCLTHHFLNQATTFLILSESNTPITRNIKYQENEVCINSQTLKALSHLSFETSNELEIINASLNEQKETFEKLYKQSTDGILLLKKGLFIDCNDAIVKMLKYKDKKDLLNTHPSKLSPEFQPEGWSSFDKANYMMKIALKKGSHSFEWVHQKSDGENFWAEIVLTKINLNSKDILHVVWRNIQRRKEVEFKLKELNKTLDDKIKLATNDLLKTQKIAKIGSWKVDNRTMKLWWSSSSYHIMGINEIKNPIISLKCFFKFVHPDDILKVKRNYDNHLETKEPYVFTHRFIRPDNQIIYIEERCQTTFDSEGNPLVSEGTIQDITEQKVNELRLKERDTQLLKQSRLVQMGEMISMIAHQWRQPLSAISATTSAISLKAKLNKLDNTTALNLAQKISEYSQHLSTTINDFRNFFKSDKIKQKITFTEIINSVLSIVETSIENKNIIIIKSLKSERVFNTYPNEIKQVILNLIKNAEDTLYENKIENPQIIIESEDNILKIKDNGGGISPDIIDKIFDPYFSTKLEKNGTGLGLYMSKIIIEEHCNGILNAKNEHNGVTFSIILK